MGQAHDLALWRSGRDYYAGGKRVFRMVGGAADAAPSVQVTDGALMTVLEERRGAARPRWLRRPVEETRALLRRVVGPHIAGLEEEAVFFLRRVRAERPGLPLVVSWSGGKDSAAASAVAQRAFPDERVPHVFADTTIELPTTYEHMAEFRRRNPATPFLVGTPVRGFFELAREIGPPSRVQKWCCTTHKAAPLTDVLRAVGGGAQVLTVGGLRRSESQRRQEYPRIIEQGKIGVQVLLSPLADWSDFDVWAWTLSRDAAMNAAYRLGFDRVGCAFCPDSGAWSRMLGVAAFSDYFRPWHELIAEVAMAAGLEDPDGYALSGAWRSRVGGDVGTSGLPNITGYDIETSPCEHDGLAVTYALAGEYSLSMLGELLKVFGRVSYQGDGRVLALYDVVGPHGSFSAKAMPRWRKLRVQFATAQARRKLEGTIRLQLRKLQTCVSCGACAALCPHSAVTRVGADYRIAEDRCTHCLACARGLRAGCRAAQSLNWKKVGKRA